MIFTTARTLRLLTITAMAVFFAAPAMAKTYVPNLVTVSLQRQPDNSGEAYIRLSTPLAMNGCPVVGSLNHTAEIDEPYIDVTVEDYDVDFEALKTVPKPTCDGAMQFATA